MSKCLTSHLTQNRSFGDALFPDNLVLASTEKKVENEWTNRTSERDEIPFDGGLWFAGDGGFKLYGVKLDALYVLRFLHELRHLFLSCKVSSTLVIRAEIYVNMGEARGKVGVMHG